MGKDSKERMFEKMSGSMHWKKGVRGMSARTMTERKLLVMLGVQLCLQSNGGLPKSYKQRNDQKLSSQLGEWIEK